MFKHVADESDGTCQLLNGSGPHPLPVGCRLDGDTTSVVCLPRVLLISGRRGDASVKWPTVTSDKCVTGLREGHSVLL